jgi:VanZ family protein
MNLANYRRLLILYLVMILIASSIPGRVIPELKIFSWDKLLHMAEYTILGFLAARSVPRVSVGWLFVVIVGGLLFAGLDETYQSFIPGRDANPYDAIADGIGVIFGTFLSARVVVHRT